MKGFASDNYAGVLPEIMEALQAANSDHAISYGKDKISERVTHLMKSIFGEQASVFFVFNGTGANILSLSGLAGHTHSILCADCSHLYNDESSAPEAFTRSRLIPVTTDHNGKLTVEALREKIIRIGDIHFPQPRVISITQATEYGTVYTPAEIKAIQQLAQEHNLYLHMDGSRLWNAAAYLDCDLNVLTREAGVDVLSLGGTKLGLMFGDAVVVWNPSLIPAYHYLQKQTLQLASKTRFIAAQFEALLQDGLWKKTASHANRMATLLALELSEIPQIQLTKPTQANAVFACMPPDWIPILQKEFPFYIWNEATNEVRLMCAFDTHTEEVKSFVSKIRELAVSASTA